MARSRVDRLSERARRALPAGVREVLLVPWGYAADCYPVPWSRSARWLPDTLDGVFAAQLRPREHWAGDLPALGITPFAQPYRNPSPDSTAYDRLPKLRLREERLLRLFDELWPPDATLDSVQALDWANRLRADTSLVGRWQATEFVREALNGHCARTRSRSHHRSLNGSESPGSRHACARMLPNKARITSVVGGVTPELMTTVRRIVAAILLSSGSSTIHASVPPLPCRPASETERMTSAVVPAMVSGGAAAMSPFVCTLFQSIRCMSLATTPIVTTSSVPGPYRKRMLRRRSTRVFCNGALLQPIGNVRDTGQPSASLAADPAPVVCACIGTASVTAQSSAMRSA